MNTATETNQQTDSEQMLGRVRNEFAGCSVEQMRADAGMLGISIPRDVKGKDNIREHLLNKIGFISGHLSNVDEVGAALPKKRPKLSINTRPPNLTAAGKWGGKYRRVKLVRTDMLEAYQAFPIGWEGNMIYFHFDTEVDMPWPHYQVLKNMIEKKLIRELSPDKKSTVTTERMTVTLPMTDMGTVPGTEHLPGSMMEYVQWLAQDNGNFKDFNRQHLMRVARLLHGQSANSRFKDFTDQELLDAILTFIGVDIYGEENAYGAEPVEVEG